MKHFGFPRIGKTQTLVSSVGYDITGFDVEIGSVHYRSDLTIPRPHATSCAHAVRLLPGGCPSMRSASFWSYTFETRS